MNTVQEGSIAMRSAVLFATVALASGQWDCSDPTLSRPIQYLKCGTTGTNRPLCSDASLAEGHGFYSLDVSTGTYVPHFTISANDISSMNSCGINPVDGFAYCAARVDGSTNVNTKIRLIRFGSTHVDSGDAQFEYVAVLPVPIDTNPGLDQEANVQLPNTGTFSGAGNYYVCDRWCSTPRLLARPIAAVVPKIKPATHSFPHSCR